MNVYTDFELRDYEDLSFYTWNISTVVNGYTYVIECINNLLPGRPLKYVGTRPFQLDIYDPEQNMVVADTSKKYPCGKREMSKIFNFLVQEGAKTLRKHKYVAMYAEYPYIEQVKRG